MQAGQAGTERDGEVDTRRVTNAERELAYYIACERGAEAVGKAAEALADQVATVAT